MSDAKRVHLTPLSGAGDRFSRFKRQNRTRIEVGGGVLVMQRQLDFSHSACSGEG
jgi:hypothetical protein